MDQLIVGEDGRPVSGQGVMVGVVMLVASGQNDEIKWFEYRPTFFGATIKVEWEKETMNAVLQAEVANYLIDKGYARLMKASEVTAYNKQFEPKEEPRESRKSKGD
jgi:hypothetical protein